MEMQQMIDEAMVLLPPFDTYFMDRVQVPIFEPAFILVSDSYLPSREAFKTKTITFQKNFSTKKWKFCSKDFN